MYTPKHFLGKDRKSAVAFMKRFNFGTIVTSVNEIPVATHLPFIIDERDEEVIIISHFAKANPHWKHIEFHENLIIFTEPHAYVSTKHYEKKENVPTWNYISVHAYGRGKIITEQFGIFAVLEKMIDGFEAVYKNQWNELSMDYRTKMSNGIVAFEIHVNKIESKEKLSQNKKENERNNIISSLSKSQNTNEKIIAEYMQMNESKGKT